MSDEPNGIDEHTIAAFLADNLWCEHPTFFDDDGCVHHCDPDSVTENVIYLRVDGERFLVTVTKEDA